MHDPTAPAPNSPRARRYAPVQRSTDRMPDYPLFADVASRHHARWEIVYRPAEPAPYRARHRAHEVTIASDDVTTLDHLLTTLAAADNWIRPYIRVDRAEVHR
ncbi:hypothetical protein [Marinactinospora rubrisoli]|uniref:Uncharacterized protein n=1 Tax=Marinactinospora rubrisoli TaxID=2715399 RepID=A0ABW2KH05_9ACTN